jgi:pilus assembly protein CpaE
MATTTAPTTLPPTADVTTQAIFSVCAPIEVATAATDAAAQVPGAEFIGQFAEYISADKRPQFPDAIKDAAGCVALVDCDTDATLALETMDRLRQTFGKRLHLVAIGSRSDADFLLRAMRAGCDDFLTMPLNQELLIDALKRFQRSHLTEALTARGSGKVLSLFGVKGGVGTTTLAVYLALHLVRKCNKRVLLIDYKHELGHVALHLGLKESMYHFDELLRNANRLDADLLDGFVTRHNSGLEVIPSPDTCAPVPEGSAQAITSVMNYLRLRYDFIVIDSSLEYRGSFGAITAASDEIALVATPDVAALRDLVRRVDHLNNVPGFSEKLKVIVNRSTASEAVTAQDIVATTKVPITATIPNNYMGLLTALNAGEPVVGTPRDPFNQAIGQWAAKLAPEQKPAVTAPPAKLRSFFGF